MIHKQNKGNDKIIRIFIYKIDNKTKYLYWVTTTPFGAFKVIERHVKCVKYFVSIHIPLDYPLSFIIQTIDFMI